MRKTWITVKRGLLEPKHRKRMGKAIWLYLYMQDICNWDIGKIVSWKDREVAKEMGMSLVNLRRTRQKLQDEGYISCLQKRSCQEITIHNYTNPREYSGKVKNKRVIKREYSEVMTQGSTKVMTPSYSSNKDSTILFNLIETWSKYFPDKPKPRTSNKSLMGLLETRIKNDPDAVANIKKAIVHSAGIKDLHIKGWFSLKFLLEHKNHDAGYNKVLSNEYDWLNDKHEPRNGNNGREQEDLERQKAKYSTV